MSWFKQDIAKESNSFVQDLNKFHLTCLTGVRYFLDQTSR